MPSATTTKESTAGLSGKVAYADDAAAALLEGRVAELSAPDRHGWETIKHNASRTVYRKELDGQLVYLKHYHSQSLIHRIARRLGASDARGEMRFSQHLRAGGVPTAHPLAAMCSNGIEWLAMRAVAPAEPLDAWHSRQSDAGPQGPLQVQQATGALGRIVGRMHAAGLIHKDLHSGNILVRTDRGGEALVLMDLHRAVKRRWLSRLARAANLAQLYHDRLDFTSRTERLRFLKHYLASHNAGGTLRGWQRLVELHARRYTRKMHAQRDRRIAANNRYFTRLGLDRGWRGHAILASKRRMAGSKAAELEFTAGQWHEALAHPESLTEGEDVEVIKKSPSGLVVRRKLAIGPHLLDVYIKRPRRKRAWKWIADCFRSSRSLRGFRLGHALLTRRIATALPLAAIERRVGPLLLDSVLITEAVEQPRLREFLDTWLAQPTRGKPPLEFAQQRHLAQQVLWQMGRLLQRLHDNSFAHRDLKANNMLVRWLPGHSPEIVLLDLDGLMPRWHLSARQKFQGLMRLNVSLLECPVVNHAGRLRMLMGYIRRPGCGRINFKPYWHLLARWSSRKLRQQIRSRQRRQRAARRPG